MIYNLHFSDFQPVEGATSSVFTLLSFPPTRWCPTTSVEHRWTGPGFDSSHVDRHGPTWALLNSKCRSKEPDFLICCKMLRPGSPARLQTSQSWQCESPPSIQGCGKRKLYPLAPEIPNITDLFDAKKSLQSVLNHRQARKPHGLSCSNNPFFY